MGPRLQFRKQIEQFTILPILLKWLFICAIVAVLAGSASAGLLAALDFATYFRTNHFWIIAVLPFCGFVIGWIYLKFGKPIERGNDLLIDEIHDPKSVVPLRMTPLVLFGTIMSHLFGASVGREGTAVQMAGSLADQLTKPLKLSAEDRRILLMAGLSAGFSSVFGTPLAGAVFGLEVLSVGRLRYDAIFPCFAAAIIANYVTLLWGIHHTVYAVSSVPALTLLGFVCAVAAGAAFGIVGMLFVKVTHVIKHQFAARISYAPFRPFVGGVIVCSGVLLLQSDRYIGLGIPTIVDSFSHILSPRDFSLKFLFTTLSLGAGFKGGEVTPLFFIGATLGSTLSPVLHMPAPLLAAMGFVAVFAGAANTPLASCLMALELFGPGVGVYAAIACVISYLFSGHTGIYQSQRLGLDKASGLAADEDLTLAKWDDARKWPSLDLVHDLDFLIHTKRKDQTNMRSEFATLRFYFHQGLKVQAEGFLRRLTAPSMGTYLATKAKAFGIEQAIVQTRISAGFLKGDPLSIQLGELPPAKLPQCVELIDRPERLRDFVMAHENELGQVRVIMQGCEDPIYDSATDLVASLALLDEQTLKSSARNRDPEVQV